jgi:hypothetical protein
VVIVLVQPPISPPALIVVGLGLGVGIDVDHFPLARLTRGDWVPLRRCLRDPSIVVFDQAAIFEEGDVGARRRLLSHVVIGGFAIGGLSVFNRSLALVGALVLGIHLLQDVVYDAWLKPSSDGRSTNP